MVCVVDSHALVWYLTDSPRLSRKAAELLEAADSEIIVPTIVLAELKYLHHRNRIPLSLGAVRSLLRTDDRCSFVPLTDEIVDLLPVGLEIHDGIICATALVLERIHAAPVTVVTCDREITSAKLVETIW